MASAVDFPSRLCYVTATIADGQTTSPAIDLQGTTLCGVFLPGGFDGTSLGFQASDSLNGTYLAVHNGSSGDVALTVAASKYVRLDPKDFEGIRYLKLVAGSQTGDVTVTLATRPK